MHKAFDVLQMDYTSISQVTHKSLRTQFHKLSLLHHPDKTKSSDPSKFQEINEAYTYAQTNLYLFNPSINSHESNFVNDDEDYPEFPRSKPSYIQTIFKFVASIISSEYHSKISSLIQKIILNKESIETIFSDVDIETLDTLYLFIIKYKSIFHISQDTIDLIEEYIKIKQRDDFVTVIYPTIDDLLTSKLYNLVLTNGANYIIPMWHNELLFNLQEPNPMNKKTMTVMCSPILPKNMSIDENNNLIINETIPFTENLLNTNTISIKIEKSDFNLKINVSDIRIKPFQIITLKGGGIAKINEINICDISVKADIIINLTLTSEIL